VLLELKGPFAISLRQNVCVMNHCVKPAAIGFEADPSAMARRTARLAATAAMDMSWTKCTLQPRSGSKAALATGPGSE